MFRRRPNGTAEEIVDSIACMAALLAEDGREERSMERRLVDSLLFDAAVICYRAQTEHMGTASAVAWIKARIDRKVQQWAEVSKEVVA